MEYGQILIMMGFPNGLAHYRRLVSIPGLRRTLRGGKWQPTPVSLPDKSQGQRSLVGYSTVIRSWT